MGKPEGYTYTEYREQLRPQENCGVSARYDFFTNGEQTAQTLAAYAESLRHRGRDWSGVAIHNKLLGQIVTFSGPGSAANVFTPGFDYQATGLIGQVGISHGRYATTGKEGVPLALGGQPLLLGYHDRSLAGAFNGTIPSDGLETLNLRMPRDVPPRPDIDTFELMYALISAEGDTWEERFARALHGVPAAYSLTLLTGEGRLFGLRCSEGTWPLWIGQNDQGISIASEDIVDKNMDWRSVRPGELVEATPHGIISTQLFPENEKRCYYNEIYLGHPGSKFTDESIDPNYPNGMTNEEFRYEAGKELGIEHPDINGTVVGIPRTANVIARGLGDQLGLPVVDVLEKTVDRTFIAPDLQMRLELIKTGYKRNPNLPADALDGVTTLQATDDSLIKGLTAGGNEATGQDGTIQILQKVTGISDVQFNSAVPIPQFECPKGLYSPIEDLASTEVQPDGSIRHLTIEEIAAKVRSPQVRAQTPAGLQRLYTRLTGKENNLCLDCIYGRHRTGESNGHAQVAIDQLSLYVVENAEVHVNGNGVHEQNRIAEAHIDNPLPVGTINSE